jgi:BASS family bile acid:Na+ symporter
VILQNVPTGCSTEITICATLLHNPAMTISPAIYSLIMFMSAGIIIAWMNLGHKETIKLQPD